MIFLGVGVGCRWMVKMYGLGVLGGVGWVRL